MNESSSVQEALSQPLFLCPVCLRKLQKVCKFSVHERYLKLLDFLLCLQDGYTSQKLDDSISWLKQCVQYFEDNSSGCPV